MDAIAWGVGAFLLAVLGHWKHRSFLKASALTAAGFSACAIFIWPIVTGRTVSNIWPIALIFQFVCAFLVAVIIGIPFIMFRRRA